jgi:hypothetical protein
MEKIFNVLIIFGVLIAIYYLIQQHKKGSCLINKKEKSLDEITEKKSDDIIEKFNMDKIKYDEPIESKKVQFDYDIRPIEKQFLNEQKNGASIVPNYPNRWIESFDTEGNPIYNSRENVTGVLETFIEPKARFSYSFNKEKTLNMDGIMDPDDFIDGKGKSLKEIYDNSFVDFKKLVPKEKIINEKPNTNFMQAASSLYYLTPDTWIYENEKPENGGKSSDGIFASDMSSIGSVAMF